MSLGAGKLRHRLRFERRVETRDSEGAVLVEWLPVFTAMAAIEPISAREFVQGGAKQAQVDTRLTIRRRANVTAAMRAVHVTRGTIYNIAGVLPDKESGLEYLTLPASTGVGDGA